MTAVVSGIFSRPRRRAPAAGFGFLVMMAAVLALRLISEPTANLSYLLIAAYALLGRAQAIRALALSWLFTMFNPGIAPEASAASVARYAVLFAAACGVFVRSGFLTSNMRMHRLTLSTLLLGAFFIAHSLAFSPMPDVSILKAFSWTLIMATLVSAWAGLSSGEHRQLEHEIFGGLALILLASLPLAVLPVGYLRNGTGFQGILNHPQAFGPTMALLGAWSAARILSERKPGWWLIGLAGACLAMVLMSEARTAALAVVGGVALSMLLASALSGRPIKRAMPGLLSGRIWTVLGVLLVAGVVLAPVVVETATHFMTKSGRAAEGGLVELYNRSRGILIDPMLDNIAQRPWTGSGFGIASDPSTMEVARDPVLGLPVGASIEKGVTPLMVLEEVGLFGLALVALWLLRLLRSAVRGGITPLAVCLTVLILNMGEATLFSPGGIGLLPLILLGWAYASGLLAHRLRHG